jgi:pyridinium-3,5-biscarboxylic acid mononucleotide sulfurtransferase
MSIHTEALPQTLVNKQDRLRDLIASYGALAVAYSGGVDSSYLAYIAHAALGDKAHVIIADSPSIPRSEMAGAVALAGAHGWNLHVIQTQEFAREGFQANDGQRCYFCKTELFTQMRAYAQQHGIATIAYGEIVDDAADPTRLGAVAAREQKVVAPLHLAGLRKADIRALSRHHGLPTAEKASFACLASRFPTGTRVTTPEIAKVEQAEEVLRAEGFRQYRARHHGDTCRIEVEPTDFSKLLDPQVRERVIEGIRAAGYRFVSLDLQGYRTGSTAR